MQRFEPVWKIMPWYGVSGDETDHASNRHEEQFAITHLPWRSQDSEVTQWFRTFDYLHMSLRFTVDDRPGPGRFPRVRVPSRRQEQRNKTPPKGLPINFYDPGYLASLDDFERKKLRMAPRMDLSFSKRVKLYVFYSIAQIIKSDSFHDLV